MTADPILSECRVCAHGASRAHVEGHLAALRARIAELTKERDEAQRNRNVYPSLGNKNIEGIRADRARLAAEVAALREALPDPTKLRYIAKSLDILDRFTQVLFDHGFTVNGEPVAEADMRALQEWVGGDAEQRDLRTWADGIETALSTSNPRADALLRVVERTRHWSLLKRRQAMGERNLDWQVSSARQGLENALDALAALDRESVDG